MSRETFYMASGDMDDEQHPFNLNCYWDWTEWPSDVGEPVFRAENRAGFVWASQTAAPSMGDANYAHFEWVSAKAPLGTILYGGRVGVGIPFKLWANNTNSHIEVFARVKLNVVSRFSKVSIRLEDDASGAHSQESGDKIGSLSDGTWYVVSNLFDVDSFSGPPNESMRAIVHVQGANDNGDVGLCEFDIEYISIRQYND